MGKGADEMKINAISGWRDMHIRPKTVAPLSEFEAYVRSRNQTRCAHPISAQSIRRAVIMRRQGETWKDCAAAVGHGPDALRKIVEFLPMDLQP